MKASHSEQLFELMSEGVWQVDAEGATVYVNSRMSAMVGYSREEFARLPSLSLVRTEDRAWVAARIASRREGVRDDYECQIAHKDGSWVSIVVKATLLYRDDGGYDGTLAVITNVTEKKRAEGQLRAGEVTQDLSEQRAAERLFQLGESAPDGVLVVDREGRIVRVNSQAAALFGYARAELIGRPHDDLVPALFRSEHRALQAHYVAAPTVRHMGTASSSLFGLRKDGTEFPVEISLGPHDGPGGRLIIAFIRDVTELRRLQKEQIRSAVQVARLQRVTAALAGALDVETIAKTIVSVAWEATGASAGLLALAVDNGRAIELLNGTTGRPPEEQAAAARAAGSAVQIVEGRQRVPIDAKVPVCDVTRSGESLWLEDLIQVGARYPSLSPLFAKAGQKSLACLPLVAEGKPIGAVSLFFSSDHTFDDEERIFLRAVADQCAGAFDRAELRARAVRAADRVTRLQRATAALGGTLDVEAAAQVILSLGIEAAGASEGTVWRMVDHGLALEMVHDPGSRLPDDLAQVARAAGASLELAGGRQGHAIEARIPVCDVARTRTPMWKQNRTELDADYPALAPLFEKLGLRSVAVLPMISRGEMLGVLALNFHREHAFDDETRASLLALAEQSALAFDRAQLFEDTVASRDAAERATMMRDEFLSIVTHDLGNPLMGIELCAKRLRAQTAARVDGAEVLRMASQVEKGVKQITLLLRDLGDVSSIDSGHLSIRKQETDAQAIVADTVEIHSPLCQEKGLSITEKAPAMALHCDPKRVQQALGNLLANAIKFTPSGGTITVEAVPLEGEVRFSVADSGPGIPEEARERVFERYWRGEQRDFTKGLGLGLFIAKGIIESHGGRIWVESTVGRGSTFFFALPMPPPPIA